MSEVIIENFRAKAALGYAARGWRVVPLHWPKIGPTGAAKCSCGDGACTSIGKHPLTKHGLEDASTDADMIRRWWQASPSANIGVVMGPQTGSIALDIDPRNGGNESLSDLCDTYGQFPETVEARTGGGGLHLLFKHPGGRVRNSKGKIADGIDLKGDNGYIVAPPSLHASGQRYAWLEGADPDAAQLAAAPPWLLALTTEPERPPEPRRRENSPDRSVGATVTFWVDKAVGKAGYGSRNDTGHWLAQQLRDSRVPERDAEDGMRDYVNRVPQGDEPYTEREALATLRGVYRQPAREPAKSLTYAGKVVRAAHAVKEMKPKLAGASAELREHFGDVAAGRVFNAPWPWPMFTKLTQALLPGTVTTWVGDPGVGKTFAILQSLQHWTDNGVDAAVFFIEKDRKFHTMRLLAQLERDGRFTDYDWLKANGAAWDAALSKHADRIDQIGRLIYSEPKERVTLDTLLGWVRQQASAGKRVIVVDPITAVSAGEKRWTADEDFMIAAQAVMTAHGASLVLVTHSKKGNRPGVATGHDAAGGAAYFRFCDTLVWLTRPKAPKDVRYQTALGPTSGVLPVFFQIHKARNAKGSGHDIGFAFRELQYIEQGLVLGEKKGECIQPMAPADLGLKNSAPVVQKYHDPFDDDEEAK